MKKAFIFAGSALFTALGLWACGIENALVGDECATGYALSGDRCVPLVADTTPRDATAGDGSPIPDSSVLDAETLGDGGDSGLGGDGSTDGEAGTPFTCTPPLVDCHGVCVDTVSDPLNCGACDNVCPSLLCSNSKCDGTVAGHIVVFGHDYQGNVSGAQRKALQNAALLARGTNIRVRSYEQYANATAATQVKNIITAAAQAQGRTAAITVATQSSDIDTTMSVANTDVLVVYDQVNAPAATLGGLGAGWASALSTFTHDGGIVLVLDGQGGANPQMPAFLTSSLLLDVVSDTPIPVGTPLTDVASQDAVGQGLVSPYGAGQNSVHFACNEPNGGAVTYVVTNNAIDATSPPPVIIHKVAP